MRILGIDPGIATVGFGFVDQACGCALRPVQYLSLIHIWPQDFYGAGGEHAHSEQSWFGYCHGI